MTTTTTGAPAVHCIAYAYPTSEDARRMGHGAAGCYVFSVNAISTGHATYADALARAAALGTVPGRWSVDHPANAQFAPV